MSFPRLILIPTIILLASLLISSIPASAAYPGPNTGLPPMPDGYSPGSVTGKVYKTVTTDAVPFIYVALVNASNTSMIYMTTTSDETGRYRFIGISSTSGSAYRIIAKDPAYTDGQTEPFGIPSGTKVFVDVQILPKENYQPTPDPSQAPGTASGRVTQIGTGAPLYGATVCLVSPTNADIVYETTTTDQNGVFRFTDLTDFETPYQIRVSQDGFKDGYSLIFQVEPGVTTDLSVAMDLKPPEITPFPTRDPTTDGSQTSPTPEPSPGFGVAIAILASAIGVAIAGRKKE
ncbi:carboxypeptidase-like regulatory domain-containing protein [Methanocella arvoryzae]|uniref:Carboxypeptidase regulatory-like domain-containing protein n=1 Tax=Methanocella arvoryzae (strain DSM 22066 / NBRC 105507 / MRE50) TaxID=351160 RepID=Q0W1S5_METAR|nr:carboxypeptidase-like regulatory domain-containing protein [Methanocella arvoryzae]CAJ37668.1 hypothetical protein RCIX2619 [Methanocella arvoryzae MRE50]